MSDTVTLAIEETEALCVDAFLAAGGRREQAIALARAAVLAEAFGQPNVGLAHVADHIDALRAGRIDGTTLPDITRPAKAILLSDAREGVAQTGFDLAFDDLVTATNEYGVAGFAQRNAYTCGALGTFAWRLAEAGLVAVAATNGPALLAGSGGTRPVYCTNPLAFAAPTGRHSAILIDQASSATAFVNIRQAARDGRPIPEGWALDAEGNPTTDAAAAVKGALVAFGGARGANIALMVEVLAAGLTGANWSLDAPSFTNGAQSPGSGLFVLALKPALIDPDFESRLAGQAMRLSEDYGVHVPGQSKGEALARAMQDGLTISRDLHDRLKAG